ncbi:hypothetical protein [Ekhidna sp.]
MQEFLKRVILYAVGLFLILEVGFRIFLDKSYFQKVNPYSNLQNGNYTYVFIGSSRFEVAIDENLLADILDSEVLNTARGFYSAGVSYQALKNALEDNPSLIDGAKVILEYPQFLDAYLSDFNEEKYHVWEKGFPMVQFLIPHLQSDDLSNFLRYSPNTPKAKFYLVCAYYSSVVRNIPVIQEYLLDNFIKIKSWNMTQQIVHQVQKSEEQKQITDFSDKTYAQSLIFEFKSLVEENGGELILLDVPKYSSFNENFKSDLLKGQSRSTRLPVISVDYFNYSDSDFDDKLHLNEDRVEEFTSRLATVLSEYN